MKKFLVFAMLGMMPYINSTAQIYEIISSETIESYKQFNEGFGVFRSKTGKYGFVNEKRKIVIPAIYDDADHFLSGRAKVKLDGKYGFIDTLGNTITQCKYDATGSFVSYHYGHTFVSINNKYGFINYDGKEITDLKYSSATNGFNKLGLASVQFNGKWGLIDTSGKEITSFKYDNVIGFSVEVPLAQVQIGNKWGYIDNSGNEVIPCIYERASTFHHGIACVIFNGKIGFIDKCGKIIIPFKYDRESDHQRFTSVNKYGIYFDKVLLNGKSIYIDLKGNEYQTWEEVNKVVEK